MTKPFNRRQFLSTSALAGTTFGFYSSSIRASERVSANDTLAVAVLGVNGQGQFHAESFAKQPGSEVVAICDVDQHVISKGLKAVEDHQRRTPTVVEDLRRILDDPKIDAISIAMPNHWHAPATILACAAGKHVYVEKPCSYTPEEGELAVAAARKYNRVVQMGTQRRSCPHFVEAVKKIHAGEIGVVRLARAWYSNRRLSIGIGKEAPPPSELNYDLWQGPAPVRPYKDNLVHYNWHWHWHWGNGELGNNGIHSIDVARWALRVDYPTLVSSAGARLQYKDDQETPDTNFVTMQFDDKMITWEGLSCSPYGPGGTRGGLSFHGDKGTMHLHDQGYELFDLQNNQVAAEIGNRDDAKHYTDFLSTIRNRSQRPTADIEEGHKSTLLCHLGNIAYRIGRPVKTDPQTGHIEDDAEASALWNREYHPNWKPAGAKT